jgi:anti-sigma regulatory factor (Ser/Thr protein kinase)
MGIFSSGHQGYAKGAVLKESEEMLRLRVPCDKTAAAVVRAAVSRIDEHDWVMGDAMLVASELVTNVVRQAAGEHGHVIDVEVRRDRGTVAISVRDPLLPAMTGPPLPPRPPSSAGLGLAIVDTLSQRWGTNREQGYHVWAELPVL